MIIIDKTHAHFDDLLYTDDLFLIGAVRIINLSSKLIFVKSSSDEVRSLDLDSSDELTESNTILLEQYTTTITISPLFSRVYTADGELDIKVGGTGVLIIPENGEPYISDEWSPLYGFGIPDLNQALDLNIQEPDKLPESELNNNDVLNMFNALEAWNAGFDGSGIRVAILDVGIVDHPEVKPEFSIDFWQGENELDLSYAKTRATSLASIIAGSKDSKQTPDITGIAYGASILDYRVLGSESSWETVSQGLRHAVNAGAKVVQISIQSDLEDKFSTTFKEAVEYAIKQNVLLVFHGNAHNVTDSAGSFFLRNGYPVITVDNLNIESLWPENFGKHAVPNNSNHFFAPSSGWYPAENEKYHESKFGDSSFSAAYIGGIAAIIFQKYPGINLENLIERLKNSSWIPKSDMFRNLDSDNYTIQQDIQGNDIPVFEGTIGIDILNLERESTEVFQIFSRAIVPKSMYTPSLGIKFDDGKLIATSHVEKISFSDNKIATSIFQLSVDDAFQAMYAYTKKSYFSDHHIRGLVINLVEDLDKSEVPWFINEYLFGQRNDLTPSLTLAAENVFGWSADTTKEWVDDFLQTPGTSASDAFWIIAESETASVQIDLFAADLESGVIWYDDVSLI